MAGGLQTSRHEMNPLRLGFRPRQPHNDEAGVELIEFALVFPLLLVVILGVVDFAFVFQRWEALTNATREGARIAALPGYATVDVEDRVATYLAAGGVPTYGGNPVVTVTPTTIAQGAATWPATTVSLSYVHDYLFLDSVMGWFGGSFSSSTLTTQATIRNEISGP